MVIKNVVFTGGGLRGWAYIGTIRALNESKKFNKIEQVAGVSIGSLFGLMYLLKVPWETLLDYAMNLDYNDVIDMDLDNLLINQSLMSGIKFMDHIKEFIALKIDPEITFIELKKHSKVLFTTLALNVNDSKVDYFNYQLTPDIKVADAIRASCSLPGILPSYSINGKNYFDGGICNNTPLEFLTENDTIAFDICLKERGNNNTGNKIADLLNSMMDILNVSYRPKADYEVHQILDSRFQKEVVNFNQTKDDIFNIYMVGYRNSKEIIFKNYIALPDISSGPDII
jgi:predicted acylesterase/phospholipase RssA